MLSKIINMVKSCFGKKNMAQESVAAGPGTPNNVAAPETAGQETDAQDAGPDEPNQNTEYSWDAFTRQVGFFNYTTDKSGIGFYLDPENRWVVLAKSAFPEGIEQLYEKRMQELSRSTPAQKLREKLEQVAIPEGTEPSGYQLTLPGIDNEVKRLISAPGEPDRPQHAGGRDAYPCRVALGSLIVQSILGLSDRGTARIIQESPYIQYFLGFEEWSAQNTVHPSSLVYFRKRLGLEAMKELNELYINESRHGKAYLNDAHATVAPQDANTAGAAPDANIPGATQEDNTPGNLPDTQASGEPQHAGTPGSAQDAGSQGAPQDEPASANAGTLILDATCGPVYIRYPQDFSLLNEARRGTDVILSSLCKRMGLEKPRTNPITIQKEAQRLSKTKKKQEEQIRHVIRLELNAIKRNLDYLEGFVQQGASLTMKEAGYIQTVRTLYAQQRYMYENHTHTVRDRIVSVFMPFIRPINRGKVDRPTEFGPKFDLGVDKEGFSRIVHFSFQNYNESTHLEEAAEAYREQNGHYPACIEADQIYRTRGNLAFCKKRGIRLSGPPLGRKPASEEKLKAQEKLEKQDLTERIEVERHFSREKRCFGLDPIMKRTPQTIEHTVGMAVYLDNIVPTGF